MITLSTWAAELRSAGVCKHALFPSLEMIRPSVLMLLICDPEVRARGQSRTRNVNLMSSLVLVLVLVVDIMFIRSYRKSHIHANQKVVWRYISLSRVLSWDTTTILVYKDKATVAFLGGTHDLGPELCQTWSGYPRNHHHIFVFVWPIQLRLFCIHTL